MKAITQLVYPFPLQSYFDSTRLANALAVSKSGSIFAGTPQVTDVVGYGLALAPWSATPIAVQIYGDAESSPFILAPGQSISFDAPFKRIEWGVPFGWFGGGIAPLLVLHDPAARVSFASAVSPRLLFQRVRVGVDAAVGAIVQNWPGASPWLFAAAWNGAANVGMAAGPILQPEPDVALMRCRQPLDAPVTVQFIYRGVNDFDIDSAGVVQTTDQTSFEVTVPASPDGTSLPLVWLPSEVHKLTCSGAATVCGGLSIVDASATITGDDAFFDILRYVRLT